MYYGRSENYLFRTTGWHEWSESVIAGARQKANNLEKSVFEANSQEQIVDDNRYDLDLLLQHVFRGYLRRVATHIYGHRYKFLRKIGYQISTWIGCIYAKPNGLQKYPELLT